MKFVSFNVNSLRTRLHQLQMLVEAHQPDFIGLQETKVEDDLFPIEEVVSMGYNVEFHGQKTHYGVALMSRDDPIAVQKGFPGDTDDSQKRFIAATFELADGKKLQVLNGYFPQGESRDHPQKFPNKERFYADITRYIKEHVDPAQPMVLMGDLNVAPQDIDIGIGEQNRKRWLSSGACSFLPEERAWFEDVINLGLTDTYRQHFPDDTGLYSWFDYRGRGFEKNPKRGLRIDFVLSCKHLTPKLQDAGIDYDIRNMDRPSDHCPVWAEFTD